MHQELDEVLPRDEVAAVPFPAKSVTADSPQAVAAASMPVGAHQSCGATGAPGPAAHIYAIGRVEARFPSLSVEKEFAQAAGRTETAALSDQEVFESVLSDPDNRYLARLMCWVLITQGLDTYLLQPAGPEGLDLLIGSIRPQPGPVDLDVVVGTRTRIASPDECNGLMLPIVSFDQIYSFPRDQLMNSIPRPQATTEQEFQAAATDVFDRVMRIADNAGATEGHRALNYLAVRYADLYVKTAEQFGRDFSLSGVETRPRASGGSRQIVNCVLTYSNRNSGFVEKYAVAVDTTDRFPFLMSPLSTYLSN